MPITTTTTYLGTGNFTFGSGVDITVTNGNGVFAYAIYVPTLTNAGIVVGNGTGRYGVDFAGSGTVINSGSIGGTGGVRIDGAGALVVNSGSIISSTGFVLLLKNGGSVTNTSGGTISGGGVYFKSGAGILFNAGQISGGYVVEFNFAAAVTNTGMILGTRQALEMNGGGSLDNSGTITGTATYGVQLGSATLTNESGALISGNAVAVGAFGSGDTIVNSGTIAGGTGGGSNRLGVNMRYGGILTNNAGGTIIGGTAVKVAGAAATVTNAGTMNGTANAIQFSAGYANELNVDPGAVFSGTIDGGNTLGASIASTLDFGSGSGILDGFGTSVVNFGSVVFSPGAAWSISGTPGVFGAQAITGFSNGDRIDVQGIGVAQSAIVSGSTVELFSGVGGGGSLLFTFTNLTGTAGVSLNPAQIGLSSDGAGGTFVACFAAGTRILTDAGEVPVEELRDGQLIYAMFGGALPVVWLGRRRIDCRRHLRPHNVWPVRVRAHAFGPDRPRRDLLLSPDHAVFANEVLIPVRHLINGSSIAQEPRDHISYFHVELPVHDVLLAEGLPVESYLEVGDRSNFANSDGPIRLFPESSIQTPDARALWDAYACAPLVVTGVKFAAVRQLVNGRAVAPMIAAATRPGSPPSAHSRR